MKRKQKILVIEDDGDALEIARVTLEGGGYQVIAAMDGDEGLKMLAEETPDLVLLDISMPVMDGWEVCKFIKGNNKYSHIPVIMFTARGEIGSMMEAKKIGADDYMAKPVTAETILEKVNRMLRIED